MLSGSPLERLPPAHYESCKSHERAENEKTRSEHNQYVGDVKDIGRKVVPGQIEKVYHDTFARNAVEKIAEAASAKKRQGKDRERTQSGARKQDQGEECQEHGDCDGDGLPAPPFRQQSLECERGPLVLAVVQFEGTARQGDNFCLRQVVSCQVFGGLIAPQAK